jgi:arsenate reductase
MVCDSANEACPVVFGAKQRHSLLFVDPKHSDGSSEQADVYDNTLRTIASEMGYIVRKILELRG